MSSPPHRPVAPGPPCPRATSLGLALLLAGSSPQTRRPAWGWGAWGDGSGGTWARGVWTDGRPWGGGLGVQVKGSWAKIAEGLGVQDREAKPSWPSVKDGFYILRWFKKKSEGDKYFVTRENCLKSQFPSNIKEVPLGLGHARASDRSISSIRGGFRASRGAPGASPQAAWPARPKAPTGP